MPEVQGNEVAGHGAAASAATARPSRRAVRWLLPGLIVVALATVLVSVQAILFYQTYTPQVAQANRVLFDLIVEGAQPKLYGEIASRFAKLRNVAAAGRQTEGVAEAWGDFRSRFAAAPNEAITGLRKAVREAGAAGREPEMGRLEDDLRRLEGLYTDRYEGLLEELENPPVYLWPGAHWLAERSGYRDAVTLNHALHLAQTGDIGTARVILAGLRGATEDPRTQGLVYYLLGRLQFELFRSRPEAEFYTQAVDYLRQSLRADPESELAQRFIDYLLSVSQDQGAPRAGEGQPTTPSEGEGAAISADQRRF